MRGLTKGEQSSTSNPVLVFVSRLAGFLTDPYSAAFLIQDIRDPTAAPVTKVASTPINLVSDKLGVGRFAIPTGSTATWSYGTHRVVVTYKMEDGGPDYTQVIPFEILEARVYPVGASYIGHAATADLIGDGYTTLDPEKLHPTVHRVSQYLEQTLGRAFEPRYLSLYTSGEHTKTLFLQEAIIAIEDVYYVERQSDGTDLETAYGQDIYRVYNRHLDPYFQEDDRQNPRISLLTASELTLNPSLDPTLQLRGWPNGRKNIVIKGIFGYTDPEPVTDRILIGHTPKELFDAIGVLLSRYLADPTMDSPATQQPGRIKMYKTRDQAVQFFGPSTTAGYNSEITGDTLLDQRLLRMAAPVNLLHTDRDW